MRLPLDCSGKAGCAFVMTMKFWILLFWLRTTWLLDLNLTISNTCISITIQVVSFFQILISVEKYPITIGVTIYLLWNSSANDNWINSVPRVHGIHNAKKWVGFLSFLICVYFWFSFLFGVISDFFNILYLLMFFLICFIFLKRVFFMVMREGFYMYMNMITYHFSFLTKFKLFLLV